MGKKSKFFTLTIIPSSYGKARRIVIPRYLITTGIIGLVLCFFAFFYFISEYNILKEKLTYFENLEELAQTQQEKIASLAGKIDQFNNTLAKLREMENRLKTMVGAGIEDADIEEDLGEGGPDEYIPFENWIPEKIDTDSLQTIKTIESNFKFLRNEAMLREQNFIQIQKFIEGKKVLFSSIPNIFPVKGWLSAGYGLRINPFTKKREMHQAIDIAAPWGTSVKAACQGKVTYAGWKDCYGLAITIKNGYNYSTVYGHLSKVLVEKGDQVEKGQIIGRLGSSGRSTGPHLHFEVWKGGKTINPLNLMVEPLSSN